MRILGPCNDRKHSFAENTVIEFPSIHPISKVYTSADHSLSGLGQLITSPPTPSLQLSICDSGNMYLAVL